MKKTKQETDKVQETDQEATREEQTEETEQTEVEQETEQETAEEAQEPDKDGQEAEPDAGDTEPDGEDGQEEQAQDPQEDSGIAAENAWLRRELLEANGRLAAYAAGVSQEMASDAVTLAMAQAAQSGEVTEKSLNAAMREVLKRHPEWLAKEKSGAGGFRIGADPDRSRRTGKTDGDAVKNVKRWNRFK